MKSPETLLKNLLDACPMSCNCSDMHHKKSDRHGFDGVCKPLDRYDAAVNEAAAYFLKKKEEE